jgi:hypothetical protein
VIGRRPSEILNLGGQLFVPTQSALWDYRPAGKSHQFMPYTFHPTDKRKDLLDSGGMPSFLLRIRKKSERGCVPYPGRHGYDGRGDRSAWTTKQRMGAAKPPAVKGHYGEGVCIRIGRQLYDVVETVALVYDERVPFREEDIPLAITVRGGSEKGGESTGGGRERYIDIGLVMPNSKFKVYRSHQGRRDEMLWQAKHLQLIYKHYGIDVPIETDR